MIQDPVPSRSTPSSRPSCGPLVDFETEIAPCGLLVLMKTSATTPTPGIAPPADEPRSGLRSASDNHGSGCGPCTANAADRADLAELLRSGAEASSAKRWQVCVDAYSAAGALESTPRTWGELGLCEEQLGRFVAAQRTIISSARWSRRRPVL